MRARATVSPRAGRGHAGRPGAWLAAAAAVLALCGCDGTIAGTFAGDGGAPASDGPRIDMDGAIAMGFDAGPVPSSEQRPAGAIMFTDVTMQAGLGNAVSGGNQHGVGIAMVDLDGDGWADIFIANGTSNASGQSWPSALWHNNRDGTFSDVTAQAGVALSGIDCYSVAAGDYDNDGDVDLYVSCQPTGHLFRNNGDGTFTDVTAAAGAGGPASNPALVSDGKSKIAVWGDYDNDGQLDLACSSSTLPQPFVYVLKNRGDGTFTDVTAQLGVRANSTGNPCAVMFSDYDNDGDVDLHIWNDRGGHILLRNEAGASFTDVTAISMLDQVAIVHPMGIDGADVDHDGKLDYYVSNAGNNPLLHNNGNGTFTDISLDAGVGGDFGWGLAFEDFDGDGWVDILVTQEDNTDYLIFHNRAVVPPKFDEIRLPHRPVLDANAAHNVAAAFADFDHDGRVDAVVANTDGSRIILFRNVTDQGSHRWLHVRAVGKAGVDNVSGIGARVEVKTGSLIQVRDIEGGSSRASQNELSVRFGLGDWTGAEWVRVHWPSGRERVVTGIAGNQVLRVDEP
ncbi:MAG TPA: CRTAC1 family protein [Polyangia bacterium]|nr:CRTAC1 family protein [Polyangia bacterium]